MKDALHDIELVLHQVNAKLEQMPTLRDRFAMAVVGDFASQLENNAVAAREAYLLADVMLEARK